MRGYVAVTDPGWYERLARTPGPKDANFWRPSTRAFRLDAGTPFFFKLEATYDAIAGFGYFASFSILPDWLAWETFGAANGVEDLVALRARLARIQEGARIGAGRCQRFDVPSNHALVRTWPRPAMDRPMTLLEAVTEALAGVTTPGTFATRQVVAADALPLGVIGIGPLALPVTAAAARRLAKLARPARYGRGTETLLDRRVRDTGEIGKTQLSIDAARWRQTLDPLTPRSYRVSSGREHSDRPPAHRTSSTMSRVSLLGRLRLRASRRREGRGRARATINGQGRGLPAERG